MHLGPWRYLVQGSFTTCDLGGLHRGGCGKIVALLTRVLRDRGGRREQVRRKDLEEVRLRVE